MKSCVKISICLILLGCLFSCSKKEKKDVKSKVNYKELVSGVIIKPDQPISSRPLQAVVQYKQPKKKYLTKLEYQWLVNGDVVPEATKRTLLAKFFKKHDRVQCVVSSFLGNKLLKRFKSKKKKVANSPPQIRAKRLPMLQVPSEFVHRVEAVDPDGDELQYRLLSPIDQAIRVDAVTGQVRWNINQGVLDGLFRKSRDEKKREEEADTDHGQIDDRKQERVQVKISIQVSDGDGGITLYSFNLNLKKEGKKIQSAEEITY